MPTKQYRKIQNCSCDLSCKGTKTRVMKVKRERKERKEKKE